MLNKKRLKTLSILKQKKLLNQKLEISTLDNEFNKQNLKFSTSTFGLNNFSSNIIKKALYNPNTTNEVVLYDFQMLKDAREKPDFDFSGLQKVIIENDNLIFKWL